MPDDLNEPHSVGDEDLGWMGLSLRATAGDASLRMLPWVRGKRFVIPHSPAILASTTPITHHSSLKGGVAYFTL